MFTTIGWYTERTEYEKVMMINLLPSLINLNVPYKIYPVESIGDWKHNTNLKGKVIKSAFSDLNSDLLIIDADAKLHCFPKLLEEIPEEYDCAMFWLDWNEWYKNGSNVKELCSGTLYFRNRKICKDLVDEWINFAKDKNITDQKALEGVLGLFPKLKTYKLPYEYCWISTLPGNRKPHVTKPKKIVVEHFQASRTLKRNIK